MLSIDSPCCCFGLSQESFLSSGSHQLQQRTICVKKQLPVQQPLKLEPCASTPFQSLLSKLTSINFSAPDAALSSVSFSICASFVSPSVRCMTLSLYSLNNCFKVSTSSSLAAKDWVTAGMLSLSSSDICRSWFSSLSLSAQVSERLSFKDSASIDTLCRPCLVSLSSLANTASFSCSSISNIWRESRSLHRSPISIMACFQSAIAAASPLVKYSMTVCLSVKVLLTLVRSWTNLVTLASAVENISFVALTCD